MLQHACLPTLAQAALLALAAHVHVHFTAAVVFAGVLGTFNDAASKEALTALTAQHIVMETRGLVTTHTAHLIAKHLWSRPLLSLHWLTIYKHIKKREMRNHMEVQQLHSWKFSEAATCIQRVI